jgi:hypothetical protein
MSSRADLVIDETAILQFRYWSNLLIALNTCACGRLQEYETFVACRDSCNDMLNLSLPQVGNVLSGSKVDQRCYSILVAIPQVTAAKRES